CAQVTRLPGFFNHKYRPAPMVVADYETGPRPCQPADFPSPFRPTESGPPIAHAGDPARSTVRERARRYVAAIPPAVAGQHGDTATFRVCCRLVRGFDLAEDEALVVLSDWNGACEPPWS